MEESLSAWRRPDAFMFLSRDTLSALQGWFEDARNSPWIPLH